MVIEFYGDYWHRNPKKYKDKISGEIRKKDRNRIDILNLYSHKGSRFLIQRDY